MLEHIKKLFLVIVALSCLTCFQRADINLPLFAFTIFLWDWKHPHVLELLTKSQKRRLYYLITFTWIIDFVWIIFWGATWSSSEYRRSGASGITSFVMAISIINFIIKVC